MHLAQYCPACGAPQDIEELVEQIEELQRKAFRLSNHIMSADKENQELKRQLASLARKKESE